MFREHFRAIVHCGRRRCAIWFSKKQPLAATCQWLQVAASGCKKLQVAASGYKWLQVAASGCKWLQVAASGCGASGCKWLHVVACGCKWLRGCLCEQLFSIEVSKLDKAWQSDDFTFIFVIFVQDLNARAAKCQGMMAYCETIRSEFRRRMTDVMAMATPKRLKRSIRLNEWQISFLFGWRILSTMSPLVW